MTRGLFTAFLRRFRPPRRLRATAEGKWFVALTLGVGAAAVNTGNNLLYLALSLNLILIILSGVLSEWSLRRVTVRIRPASEAFAGRDALLAVVCGAAGKRFPPCSLTIALSIDGSTRAVLFPNVPPGGSATRAFTWRPSRRGPVVVRALSLSTTFPFSLFEKSAELGGEEELLVYPEPTDAEAALPGEKAGPSESTPVATAGGQGAFPRGAREHMPSDPVRDIHWKASARMGRWMVKERETESGPAENLDVPVPSAPEVLERIVSGLCARLLRCENVGRPYRLRVGEETLVSPGDTDRRGRALAILARVSPDGTLSHGHIAGTAAP